MRSSAPISGRVHETRLAGPAPAPGAAPVARTEVVISYPAGEAREGAILFPPHPLLGGDLDNNVILALARALPLEGLAAFRFNYRGAGRDAAGPGGVPRYEYWKGVEERADYAAVLEDARAAHAWACRLFDPAALVGYSFGAVVAARLAAEDGLPLPLALVCPPFPRLDLGWIADREAPTLVVVAGEDAFGRAPVERLRETAPRARVVRLEGEDHFFVGREDRVIEVVLDFLRGARKGGKA